MVSLSRGIFFSPLLLRGVLHLQGNAPILLPKPIRFYGNSCFMTWQWILPCPQFSNNMDESRGALSSLDFFLSATSQFSLWSSLSQDFEYSRFPLPSLRLSKMLFWSQLKTFQTVLAPLVPFTICVRISGKFGLQNSFGGPPEYRSFMFWSQSPIVASWRVLVNCRFLLPWLLVLPPW